MTEEIIPVAKPVVEEPRPPVEAASGQAIAALILGVLSLLCLGFLSGIPAIILGKMELSAIAAGRASKAGEGIAKVGFILGIVGTVLTCLVILGIVLICILGFSSTSLQNLNSI